MVVDVFFFLSVFFYHFHSFWRQNHIQQTAATTKLARMRIYGGSKEDIFVG
jgi:hypothetical protein